MLSALCISKGTELSTLDLLVEKGLLRSFQGAGSLTQVVDLDIEVLFCKSLPFVFVIVCELCMYQLLIHFVFNSYGL